MSMKYVLEVYEPNSSGYDVLCKLEAESPFLAIQTGDILNPRAWPAHVTDALQATFGDRFRYGAVLRVTGMEHFIFQHDGPATCHKIGVFTEAVEDVAPTRP